MTMRRLPCALSLTLVVVVAVTSGGCYVTPKEAATPLIRVHAARDLDCPDEEIRIEQELTGDFKAVGATISS